jgi:hypothetical protein
MPTPWITNVRNRKKLFVFAHDSVNVSGGFWNGVLKQAIDAFNSLNLRVTMETSPDQPDRNGAGGADVQFEAAGGPITVTFNGTGSVKRFSNTIDPIATEGAAVLIPEAGEIIKCFIFVPSTPKIKGSTSRGVDNPVKLWIAVHELIHAAGGLEDSEHSPENNPDVFLGFPSLSEGTVDPQTGKREQDGIILKKAAVGRPAVVSRPPPIPLSAATKGKINQIWPS